MKSLRGYRRVMLALAFLITFTEHLLLFSYSPLISQIMQEMQLSNVQAFSLFSASFLTLTILRIPWGLFSDRVGVRRAVGLAVALMGVAGVLRGFATDYWILLPALAVICSGFGVGAGFHSRTTIIGRAAVHQPPPTCNTAPTATTVQTAKPKKYLKPRYILHHVIFYSSVI